MPPPSCWPHQVLLPLNYHIPDEHLNTWSKIQVPAYCLTQIYRGGSHSEFHLNYVKKSERALKDGVGWEEPG